MTRSEIETGKELWIGSDKHWHDNLALVQKSEDFLVHTRTYWNPGFVEKAYDGRRMGVGWAWDGRGYQFS